MSLVIAASAASLNSRRDGGDDFTMTSRTQQHRQVPLTRASYSNVAGFPSEPQSTSAVGSRFQRSQSSTVVHRHDQAADSTRLNGSVVGAYSLGSTYDEGDYDPVDSLSAGTVTMPRSTTSLQRQSGASSTYTPQPPQQQQQLTGIIRGHRRTQSTGLTDLESRPPAQVTYNNGSTSRVVVETDRGTYADSPDRRNQQAGYRAEETQRPSTTRRPGNIMVISNAGYEPTTLDHRVPDSMQDTVSTRQRLNGDRYDQNTAVVRQHVQSPSYATIHQVQQTTGPVFQRAVIVDASELISKQQAGKQLDLPEQEQQRQQHQMLLVQQREEKQQLQQRPMQREQQRQSDVDQRQPHQQLQHEVILRRHQAVTQNVAANPSRKTGRTPVNEIGDGDGQSRFKSSTVTSTTSRVERTEPGMMSNGQSRSASRSVQITDRRRQSPSNFSTNSNSSGISGGGGQSTMMSVEDSTVKRRDLIGRGDLRRSGGTDTPSSLSSGASWRNPATNQQRFSSASSSGATERSSVELGNDSSLDRASLGERFLYFCF